MATTLELVKQDVYRHLTTAWDAQSPAIIYPPVVGSPAPPMVPALLQFTDFINEGRPRNADPNADRGWGRAYIMTVDSVPSTLPDETGKRMYTTRCQLVVDCHGIMLDGTGSGIANKLAWLVWTAFQGKSIGNRIFVGTITPVEIGREGSWYQFKVTVDFSWDDVR